jgi:Fe-Mn family superoxide dismutase
MPFALPELPFARQALEPFMSAETLEYHHGKHHRAYIDKVNELAADKGLRSGSLVEIVRAAKSDGDAILFNNAAQAWNHSFFWQCLASADGQKPTGRLSAMIEEGFGSTEAMLSKLEEEAKGHFASGWAWLLLDRDGLKITSLHDADTPIVHEGMKPLLTLDLWEHAYYIDYRNDRPAFAEKVLGNIVNWEFVARNLDGDGIGRADQEADSASAFSFSGDSRS